MRRGTRITIIVLLAVLLAAALIQLLLAGEDEARFPGPRPGTPLPAGAATAP